ncbi:MAG TPA: hypothetical protein VLH56_11875 [Dissulfurispiraceae bacterium]|nr:hypothetical protein [Dissulfurispiraceae bacterium]
MMAKVRTGDPLNIPAETFNSFVDAAADYKARQNQCSHAPRASARDSNVIFVRNNSGAARNRLDVLGIGGILFDVTGEAAAETSQPPLIGVMPAEAHRGRFVVLLEPVAADGIAKAAISGVTTVRITGGAGDNTTTADIISGSPGSLSLQWGGSAVVLWRRSGAGIQDAVVRLGGGGGGAGVTTARVQSTPSALATSYSVKIFDGQNDTGDAFPALPTTSPMHAGQPVRYFSHVFVAGEICFIQQVGGVWRIVGVFSFVGKEGSVKYDVVAQRLKAVAGGDTIE